MSDSQADGASKEALDRAYRWGQMRGLKIAVDLIGDYAEEFSLTGDALKHAEYLQRGISNAINMMSLGTP